jgi:raffinose/stachyose/melibiose transport system permease protein
LHQIVASSGGFVVTDDFVQKILKLADPQSVSSLFTNPVAELKDYIVSSGFNTSNVNDFVTEMSNLMAPKWRPEFLTKPDVAMVPILFVTLWCWTGMYLILFLANMQKIDTEIMEAAKIDGANEMQIARHIVYPALSGIIFNAAVLCIAGSLNQYALIYAMTGGGPMNVTEVLSIYMYRTATLGVNYPLSNSIAMVIIVISFVLIGVTKAAEKRFGGKE